MNKTIVITSVVTAIIVVVIIVVVIKKDKKDKDEDSGSNTANKNNNENKKIEKMKNMNYISPVDFSTGIFKPLGKKYANNCHENVLWPFKLPYVFYDDKAPTDDCECLEFIQPP